MFQKATPRGQVRLGEIVHVDVAGEDVALYLVDGRVLATSNICPHAYCLLHENGVVYGENVECSCHGSTFKIETGENVNPPSSNPLATFPAEVRDGEVFIDVSAVQAPPSGRTEAV